MKKLTWVLPLFLLAGCSSSESGKEQTSELNSPNTVTLIFIDKSLSINPNNAYIRQKYQQALSQAIEANIQRKGDRLEVYFIHDNTAKAKALERVTQSEMEDVSSANQTDADAAKTSFNVSIQKERQRFLQEANAQLLSPNTSASNRYTDIQASLPVIDRQAESGLHVKAYYFSDMIESMKGAGRRDFQKEPPTSTGQAETWAREDAARMKASLTHLTDVDMNLVLPFEPTASSKVNNPNVTTYWETLFRELGIRRRVEEA